MARALSAGRRTTVFEIASKPPWRGERKREREREDLLQNGEESTRRPPDPLDLFVAWAPPSVGAQSRRPLIGDSEVKFRSRAKGAAKAAWTSRARVLVPSAALGCLDKLPQAVRRVRARPGTPSDSVP